MKRKPFEPTPWMQVGAAFAAGALLACWLGDAIERRRSSAPPSDAQLRDRIRARVACLVSHPDGIDVVVDGGLVRVSGRVLAGESDRLLSQLTQLAGVHKVYNALVTVQDPARIAAVSSLRGGGGLQA